MKKVTNVLKRNLTMSKKLALYALFSSSSMMVQAMEYKVPEESEQQVSSSNASVSPTEAVVASDSASAQSNPMDEKLSILESNYQQGNAQNPEFQNIATRQINRNLAENISIDLQIKDVTETMNGLKEQMQHSPKSYQYGYDRTQSLLDQLYEMKRNEPVKAINIEIPEFSPKLTSTANSTNIVDATATFNSITPEDLKIDPSCLNKIQYAISFFGKAQRSNPNASIDQLKAITKENMLNSESNAFNSNGRMQAAKDSVPYLDRLIFESKSIVDTKATRNSITPEERMTNPSIDDKFKNASIFFMITQNANPHLSLPDLKALTKENMNNHEISNEGHTKNSRTQNLRDSVPYVDRLVFKNDDQA